MNEAAQGYCVNCMRMTLQIGGRCLSCDFVQASHHQAVQKHGPPATKEQFQSFIARMRKAAL